MFKIKGLWKYIRKHGKHLTEDLVYASSPCLWDSDEVQRCAQRKVYYNVVSATSGDMLYLVNYIHSYTKGRFLSKNDSIDFAISVVGDYNRGKGMAFNLFLKELKRKGKKFSFLPYI